MNHGRSGVNMGPGDSDLTADIREPDMSIPPQRSSSNSPDPLVRTSRIQSSRNWTRSQRKGSGSLGQCGKSASGCRAEAGAKQKEYSQLLERWNIILTGCITK